jgi:putative ABC transport system permease protein
LSDPDFQQVLQFNIIKGRYFSREFPSDTSAIVINQAAVNLLGWDDPLGKKINNWSDPPVNFEVIGVVEDLHYESMHSKIRPMAFLHINGPFHWSPRYVSVRLDTKNIRQTIEQINSAWNRFAADLPFEYSFFNDDYDSLYVNEVQTKNLFILFSVLAIFIGCLGLFGLAAFLIEHRIREIGIRKVLGASVSGLIFLLSRQFTQWVLLANLLAWPLAWYAMNSWLENFAYHIEIDWQIYLYSGIIAMAIALLTVSVQVIKAALLNPVRSIRYE